MTMKFASPVYLGLVLLAACASPSNLPATPTPLVFPSPTLSSVATPGLSTQTSTSLTPLPTTVASTSVSTPLATQPSGSANICTDPQVPALIDSLKNAMLNTDGPLLASLVSPTNGMDVRYFHNGTMVNYRVDQAKFLFETTFEVDWGPAPGSGEHKEGAFHDVVVPDLVKIFNQPYTLHCNELKHGGASYPVNFPYDKGYYSIHFPGTDANGFLDWHTWVVGVEHVDGKPYIYALMQFFWEP